MEIRRDTNALLAELAREADSKGIAVLTHNMLVARRAISEGAWFALKAALLAVLLSGCAVQYNHATKGPAELERDWYECEKDAAAIRDPVRWDQMTDRCLATKGWTRQRGF
jgi:hypothetical protein